MGTLALLGLLGAAALAGVSAVPVEKDHIEEMVTRCIVEVLSNALSKPNALPINPECKEILKKSDRNDRERSENKQLEVRHLKDLAEIEKHHTGSVEKEQSQAEGESKKYMKGSDEEKLGHKEGKSKEEEDGLHTPIREERLHTEEKKHYQETGQEEEKSYHSEEESQESKRHDEEVEHAVLNKKSHSGGTSREEFPDGNDQHPMGHWHSEGGMQSPKRIHEGEEGEAEEERSEKYHHESKERDFSHQQEHEELAESEETEEEKQPYKPKRYRGKHRMGDFSEKKRGHGGEKEELAEESNTEEAYLWDKRNHHQKHHEESEQQHKEKSGYRGRHGSEEVEEKKHAGQESEYRERWQQSEESSEEENKRHRHSEESNEKWHEERRHRDGSHEARRQHSEGRMYLGDESEEELDRYLGGGRKEEQHHAGGRYRLWSNEDAGSQKAYTQESKVQARRHYTTKDSVEQQRYPGSSEEEEDVEKKHHSSNQLENKEENMEEGRYAEGQEYASHLPAENEKRTVVSYSPFYPLLWWKSRHFQKRDSPGEQLLEGKEESRPTLNEKSLFPEYNDYDWWEKKQILSALNHGRIDKRSLGKKNRYDMKRQYNKMDQLAQLLNYRKKSAEFPELYNSGEDMKKRHIIGNDIRSLSQRPLTEEEEKELENLATMDLELQKIAEKFNDNRRG
ncbi:secretogranin-1 isoform X1 [Accipiter gentilis]|uniref:secretogranin-1 isoform X1 n=2 Tax=Astur gentilis TaxID=8957 RepID=UPI00210FDBF4|nr:secretogranin-1 isoform X1 [Accipiter gentilis]